MQLVLILYGAESWESKKQEKARVHNTEKRKLRNDKIRNAYIREKLKVARIEDKIKEYHLRCYGYTHNKQETTIPIRRTEGLHVQGARRKRPIKALGEVMKKLVDMWNAGLTESMARFKWKSKTQK